jgi:5-methylcytosine-specific restriction enzyme A
MTIEQEFHQAILDSYNAAKSRGYPGSHLITMVNERGGLQAARHSLIRLPLANFPNGLMRLYELGLLEFSLEALVLQDRWSSLFTRKELAIAHERLQILGYYKNNRAKSEIGVQDKRRL